MSDVELWEPAQALSFSRTVDRSLIHRWNLTEVFLTDVRQVDRRRFVAGALLPREHPYYTGRGRTPDPMLLLECCRQAETYAAHAFFDVEMGTSFIMRNCSVELDNDFVMDPAVPTKLIITADTRNPRLAAGKVFDLEFEFDLWVSRTRICRVGLRAGYLERRSYAAMRARKREGPLPSSDRLRPEAAGRPVTPARVGRVNATDTVLLDVVAGREAVTATLRVPAENPSLFDHPQDHVPGMVLLEAARQIAALATEEWGGGPAGRIDVVAMEASYSDYAELDETVTLTATRLGGVGAEVGFAGPSRTEVKFHQAGAEISQVKITTADVTGAAGGERGEDSSERAAVVTGLGAFLPARVVTNGDLAARLDTNDEWIRTRTGIHQRHGVAPGEATSDLAVAAGRRALDSAGVAAADVVIVATSTPDRPCPAIAPDVATRLGLGNVPAFDVGAVCTGFIYALGTAAGMIATDVADSALVIGADAFTTILDPGDRTTRVLFGDGAGALLLRAGSVGERGALRGLSLGSDGSGSGLIAIPGGGSRQRSTGVPVKEEDTYFAMRGPEVFYDAVKWMSASVKTTVERAGWPLPEVDRVVLHQANSRILSAVAERLGLPGERFVSNIDRVGNTAAASIPLALADSVAAGELRQGHRVVLAGFGGGLTWGAVALIWPGIDQRR